MKITILHAFDVPDGAVPKRRTLGALEFTKRERGRIPTLGVPETPIPVDDEGSLIVHSAYSPHNRGLSLMVLYQTAKQKTHIFTGMATWDADPHFAFRLPTGHFIELYFQHERSVA